MANDSYHDETETLSWSQAKVFIHSPAEYQGQFITRRLPRMKSSRFTDMGTICHKILLERKQPWEFVRTYPSYCLGDGGRLKSKKAKAFEDEIRPMMAVKSELLKQALIVCENARKAPDIGDILRGDFQFEQRIDAVLDGVACRCRPDINCTSPIWNDWNLLYDFKFTERIHPNEWWRTAKDNMYFGQDAHYSRIMTSRNSMPTIFRFVVFEAKEPFRVEVRSYQEPARETARKWHSDKMQEFARRKRESDWSDNWEKTGTVSPWDLDQGEDNTPTEFEG